MDNPSGLGASHRSSDCSPHFTPMKIHCPTCRQAIPATQMNAAADTAVCAQCDEAFSLSNIIATGGGAAGFDIHNPPPGASFQETVGGWELASTTKSKMAWFLVPFMLVWSGGSLGGIYGSQIMKGEFDLQSSLFGIPFLIGTLIFGSLAAMTVFGRVVVSLDRNEGTIFTGIGPIGWTRRFDWNSITKIEEDFSSFHNSNQQSRVISLVGQSKISFGSLLTEERRYYLLQSLRQLLAARSLSRPTSF
jgi:hypothetical protein